MNIFNQIKNLYKVKDISQVVLEDKYSSFKLEYEIENIETKSREEISDFISIIPSSDSFVLSIKFGENPAVSLNSVERNIDTFIELIENEIKYLEDETVKLTLEITKNFENGSRYIYDYRSFKQFWGNIASINLLKLLKSDFDQAASVSFLYLEEDLKEFHTSNLSWGYEPINATNINYRCVNAKDNCHFGNYEDFPFSPVCFKFIEELQLENEISKKLKKLNLLFSICAIFDITSLVDNKWICNNNLYD